MQIDYHKTLFLNSNQRIDFLPGQFCMVFHNSVIIFDFEVSIGGNYLELSIP
jgi:hypothetical protein